MFWEDEVVTSLSFETRYLFIYLFTNYRIGLTGAYQVTDRIIEFETGLSKEQIKLSKAELELKDRVKFYKNWVFVINSRRLSGYHGAKLQPAVENEYDKIPRDVIDTLSIPYPYTSDTTKNHKEEIINKEQEIDISEIEFNK
jgi:hypothetical protein